jgi:plastocyanin
MTKFYLSVLALFASASFAEANIDVPKWSLPYQGTKEFTANVGETITFQWEGGHNVFIHPSMSCDLTGATLVGATSGSQYTFLPSDGSPEGTDMFFACDIGDAFHCRTGE